MADTTDKTLYGVHQIDIINLLATGADDASATSYTIDNPQDVSIAAVYEDGTRVVLKGGGDIIAIVEEDDRLVGFDVTFKVAQLMPEVDETICGGTATPASGMWESPTSDAEEAYPFNMYVWIENYTESDSRSVLDGYVKFTFPFCTGRRGTQDHSQQNFGSPSYTVEARRNESDPEDIKPAMTYEAVSSIT
jgi:hypothetical protein